MIADRDVFVLVDALVEAVDVGRWEQIERLRTALEALGAVDRFDAELRLSGVASAGEGCLCGGVEW